MNSELIVLLGAALSCPIHADLMVSNEIRHAGTSPMKRYYTSASGNLSLIDFGIKSVASSIQEDTDNGLSLNTILADDIIQSNVAPSITNKPLNYPNPFKKNESTSIYYNLSKSMDIELRIYDMMANEISKLVRNAGLKGASIGPNKIGLSDFGIDARDLSAGVYFYIIMNNGVILGKGKMAVIP